MTETSNGNSGIHTINRASPEYVPYFTIMDAFDDPLASEPSTYTELQEDETYNFRKKKMVDVIMAIEMILYC